MEHVEGRRIYLEPIDLIGGRLLLTDLPGFFRKYNLPRDHQFPSVGLKASLPFYLEKYEKENVNLGIGPWIIRNKQQRKLIGEVIVNKDVNENSLDIGYYIIPHARNKGYATEAVDVITQWIFSLNYQLVTASCEKKNIPSQKVLYKNGFKKVTMDKSFIFFEKRG